MREILLVSISALLGYIIFSAFSSASTSEEAVKRIFNQPRIDIKTQEKLAIQGQKDKIEVAMMDYEYKNKKDEIAAKTQIEINKKNQETELGKSNIAYQEKKAIENIKAGANVELKKQDNYTYLAMAFLLFLIVVLYLRYQKHLAQMELNQRREQNELLAKKEYAEKILTLLASGNLTFETERKLLKVLDELNGHHIENKPDIIYHPNPEIAQINNS